jgi:hypothetical protein
MTEKGLGRRVPKDDDHIRKYLLRAVLPDTVDHVEDCLPLPYSLRGYYDQGQEGACVGFGWSWAMSILNGKRSSVVKYDARWLYHEAQDVDDWYDTPPEEGTSVRAGGDVLRAFGHVRVKRGKNQPAAEAEGIIENRWAVSIDEIRASIARGVPAVIGVNWYRNFSAPKLYGDEYWIGREPWGPIDGGHCICIYGASDKRQAFRCVQNWGKDVPLFWLPYDAYEGGMARLIREDGEVAIVTDRP